MDTRYNLDGRMSGRDVQDRLADIDEGQLDFTSEAFLDNLNSTPLGRLLKIISSLPEIRHEKVQHVRRQLNDGRYDVAERLDEALDKVLEELITEG